MYSIWKSLTVQERDVVTMTVSTPIYASSFSLPTCPSCNSFWSPSYSFSMSQSLSVAPADYRSKWKTRKFSDSGNNLNRRAVISGIRMVSHIPYSSRNFDKKDWNHYIYISPNSYIHKGRFDLVFTFHHVWYMTKCEDGVKTFAYQHLKWQALIYFFNFPCIALQVPVELPVPSSFAGLLHSRNDHFSRQGTLLLYLHYKWPIHR